MNRRSYLSLAGVSLASLGVSSGLGSAADTDSDTFPISDYGANPSDPAHDDSPAYNEAVQAVADNGGGSVALPAGTITFDSGLDHWPLINGNGGNENGVESFGLHGQGSEKTTIETTVSFEVNGAGRDEAFRNFQLSGLTFDYRDATNQNGIVNTIDGFEIVDVDIHGSPELRNVSGTWENGIWKQSTLRDGEMSYAGLFDVEMHNVVLEDVTCDGSMSAGFWHNGSSNVHHVDCEVMRCEGPGIGGEQEPEDLTVIGGEYHHNGMQGIGVSGVSAFGTHIHDNSQDGWNFDAMWGQVLIGSRVDDSVEIYGAMIGNEFVD